MTHNMIKSQRIKPALDKTSSLLSSWNSVLHSHDISYHVTTLYLFTADQIIDIVLPVTAFSVLAANSGEVLDLPAQDISTTLKRIPAVSFWLWILILQVCLQNQRTLDSVQEDAINKPWRPIPSKRITRHQTESILNVTHVLAAGLSYYLNVFPTFLLYLFLITWYNDFGGSDYSGVARNVFCGMGYFCYLSGALSIMLGPSTSMSITSLQWIILFAPGIIASTIHTQDFRDEAGDRARGRRTLVIEFGRKPALWTVIVSVSFWSLYVPLGLFAGGWKIAVLPVVLGINLVRMAIQGMGSDGQKQDRRLYVAWTLWIFAFCPLPLLKSVLF